MTLALLIAASTFPIWLLILFLRWARVIPITRTIREDAILVAAGFSAATVGGVYPIVWTILSNLQTWGETGRTTFTFVGHLPPGVDEDDLLLIIVVGLMVFVGQATSDLRAYIVEADPKPDSRRGRAR